jgi:hypothetical protein
MAILSRIGIGTRASAMTQSTAVKENKMLEDAVSKNEARIARERSEIAKLKHDISFLESPAFDAVTREFDENLRITAQNIKAILKAVESPS